MVFYKYFNFKDRQICGGLKIDPSYKKTVEKAHGQTEIREYYQTEDIGWMHQKKQWKGLKSIGMEKKTIQKGESRTEEYRYYISSLREDIELFSRAVRGHWAVESMHWHLDVTFKEEANTTLDKTAAQNQNIIRKWCLSMLKLIEIRGWDRHSCVCRGFCLPCLYIGKRYWYNKCGI